MQVTAWTNWNNHRYIELSDSYFPEDEYLYKEYYHNSRLAVIEDIRKNNYHICGAYHQNGEYGVPVIDDKFVFKIGCREWGQLMADAYPNETYIELDTQRYLKWGWSNKEQILPHN